MPSWQKEELMGYPPRPYVNCHFCNARLSLGVGRLMELRRPQGLLMACESCSNQDVYDASMIRDALLLPPGGPKEAQNAPASPLAETETTRRLGGL